MHLVGTRLIDGRLGLAIIGGGKSFREQIGLDFLAAHICEHVSVYFHAWAKHLAALFNHFLALHRVINDVAVLKRQAVFVQDGADPLTPAAHRFQISDNLWVVHKFKNS